MGFISQTIGIEVFGDGGGVSGVPSEKVTPLRRWKVYSVLSALLVQLSAIGSISSVFRVLRGELVGYLIENPAIRVKAAGGRIEMVCGCCSR